LSSSKPPQALPPPDEPLPHYCVAPCQPLESITAPHACNELLTTDHRPPTTDHRPSTMPLFTILSIDGGGIRGIIPAMILAEIERTTCFRIAQMFDLIPGTSTGGTLALGLTIPQNAEVQRPKYKASQLVTFYEHDGREVFHSFWQNVTSLHGLLDEKYPSER